MICAIWSVISKHPSLLVSHMVWYEHKENKDIHYVDIILQKV